MTMSSPLTERSRPSFTSSAAYPGARTRQLATVEQICSHFLAQTAHLGKEHLAVSCALKLIIPSVVGDPVPHLRTAWAGTRKLHPHIGSILGAVDADTATKTAGDSESGSDPVQVMHIPDYDADDWLAKTFFLYPEALNSDQLYATVGVHKFATCSWLPQSSEVFFHTSHWRCDGLSMLTIAVTFLTILAQSVKEGVDAQSDLLVSSYGNGGLAPSIDWILDSFVDEASTPQSVKRAADAMLAEMMRGAPSVALPAKADCDDRPPGDAMRAVVTFDPIETKALLARCKTKGVSLAVATHAALILRSARYPQHEMCKSYGRFAPVDMRRDLPAPYNTPQFSVGMLVAGFPISVLNVVDEDKTFDQVCEEVQRSYERARQGRSADGDGGVAKAASLAAPFMRRLLSLIQGEVPPGMPTTQAVDYSSLGLIDRTLKREYAIEENSGSDRIVVDSFWVGTQTMAKMVQCHSWTFKDEYQLQAGWNESYYDRDFIEHFLRTVRVDLLVGLGVM